MEQIENNKQNDIDSTEISNIIINILDYYSFKKIETDDDDKWKKGTKYETGSNVPTDIDEKVKQLFLSKLENLIEAEKKKRKQKNEHK